MRLRLIFQRTRGINVSGKHVCVVPGGKPIIFFPMLALIEPGDEVIYPDPGFPIYRSMIQFLGAKGVPVPLVEERGFSFDLTLLRDSLTAKTKMLILNSPENPTGGVIPARGYARDCGDGAGARSDGAFGRNLFAALLHARSAALDCELAGHAGEDDHSGWLFENLRDDRLAAWAMA